MSNFSAFSGFIALVVAGILGLPGIASAKWSANLGYHNPPLALVGINTMKEWTNFVFEAGVGWVDVDAIDTDKAEDDEEEKDTASLGLAGGINGKYMFHWSKVRPYVQLGVGSAVGLSIGKQTGVGANFGGGYGGGGIYYGGKDYYGYISANYIAVRAFLQVGLGMNL